MVGKLKYKGSILPAYKGRFVLRYTHSGEELCPFEEKTGFINFNDFSNATEITFKREKDNPVDKLAVQVLADGRFIGYLYRRSKIRPYLLDAKKKDNSVRYIARFDHLSTDPHSVTLIIAFYVPFMESEYDKLGTWPLETDRDCRKLDGRLVRLTSIPFESGKGMESYIVRNPKNNRIIGHLPLSSLAAFPFFLDPEDAICRIHIIDGVPMASVYVDRPPRPTLHTIE